MKNPLKREVIRGWFQKANCTLEIFAGSHEKKGPLKWRKKIHVDEKFIGQRGSMLDIVINDTKWTMKIRSVEKTKKGSMEIFLFQDFKAETKDEIEEERKRLIESLRKDRGWKSSPIGPKIKDPEA